MDSRQYKTELYGRQELINPASTVGYYQLVRATSPDQSPRLYKVTAWLQRDNGNPLYFNPAGVKLRVISTTSGVTRTFDVDLYNGQSFTVDGQNVEVGIFVHSPGIVGSGINAKCQLCQVAAPSPNAPIITQGLMLGDLSASITNTVPAFAIKYRIQWNYTDVPIGTPLRMEQLAEAESGVLSSHLFNEVDGFNSMYGDWVDLLTGCSRLRGQLEGEVAVPIRIQYMLSV